jgi:predicted RNA binding protein YcfA (HicA-like mRNA interferase family)
VGDVPALKPTEVIRILRSPGFREVRRRGSHRQYRNADSRGTTLPVHKGRKVSPILVRAIAADIGLRVDEFLAHR